MNEYHTVRGEPEYVDQVPRRQTYEAAHPNVEIIYLGPVWQAIIRDEAGQTVITRYELRGLLDKLESLDAPAAGPGETPLELVKSGPPRYLVFPGAGRSRPRAASDAAAGGTAQVCVQDPQHCGTRGTPQSTPLQFSHGASGRTVSSPATMAAAAFLADITWCGTGRRSPWSGPTPSATRRTIRPGPPGGRSPDP
jgi:hypothetical protein